MLTTTFLEWLIERRQSPLLFAASLSIATTFTLLMIPSVSRVPIVDPRQWSRLIAEATLYLMLATEIAVLFAWFANTRYRNDRISNEAPSGQR